MKTVEYRNNIKRSDCIVLPDKSLLGGEKYTKCWLLIQGLIIAKEVA